MGQNDKKPPDPLARLKELLEVRPEAVSPLWETEVAKLLDLLDEHKAVIELRGPLALGGLGHKETKSETFQRKKGVIRRAIKRVETQRRFRPEGQPPPTPSVEVQVAEPQKAADIPMPLTDKYKTWTLVFAGVGTLIAVAAFSASMVYYWAVFRPEQASPEVLPGKIKILDPNEFATIKQRTPIRLQLKGVPPDQHIWIVAEHEDQYFPLPRCENGIAFPTFSRPDAKTEVEATVELETFNDTTYTLLAYPGTIYTLHAVQATSSANEQLMLEALSRCVEPIDRRVFEALPKSLIDTTGTAMIKASVGVMTR